jgi:hypothetical protein
MSRGNSFMMPVPFPDAAIVSLTSSPELDDFAAVALRWPAFRRWRELHQGLALLRKLQAQFTAGFSFAIERLRNRRWAAHLAEKQNLDLKVAALGLDLQELANPDFAGSLGRLIVGLNPAELAGPRSQGACFEESGRPEPFVHSHAGHGSIFP